MAERSKALASGASQEIGVGSNPTLVTLLLLHSAIISFCFASFWNEIRLVTILIE
ncbi:hypothetical protein GQ607_012320 [Colletotrichum asianum]|uniref:Transmembrane protein n=1 Tax=Colletotrichum asianum TaxID=702518 RepID=A0A8H3ZHW8_9PEZI|nr:hypothetical protein GQ607_012320 [Colletotrichum asianum]